MKGRKKGREGKKKKSHSQYFMNLSPNDGVCGMTVMTAMVMTSLS